MQVSQTLHRHLHTNHEKIGLAKPTFSSRLTATAQKIRPIFG